MYCTPKSYFLDRVKTDRGAGFKKLGEARVARTFDQRYPYLLVGHYSRNVAVGTLLPGLSPLYMWSYAGAFGTNYELEREIRNTRN